MTINKGCSLALLTILAQGCMFANIDLQGSAKPYRETTLKGEGDDKIALIDISGAITSEAPRPGLFGGASESMVKRVLDQLRFAGADPSVKAIVLRIDSPGGGVTASDILHREVKELRAKKGKPVVAALMDTAASGGYYIAAASDRIIAHPTTVTGSIGVIMQTFNLAGLLEKVGVEIGAIKSAAKKDIGSPFRAMTDEEQAVLQSVIDDMYLRFVDVVKEGRPELSREQVKKLADGRIFTARQALAAGLIDGIGYMDKAFEEAARLGGASAPRIVRYHRENEPPGSIETRARVAGAAPLVQVDLLSALGPLKPGFYYYWAPGLGSAHR